jgi:Cadherin domain
MATQNILISGALKLKATPNSQGQFQPLELTLKYDTDNPNLSGLTSRLHFDDTKLDFVTASIYDNGTINTPPRNSLQTDPNNSQYKIDANGVGVLNDGNNLDTDTTTNKIYLTSWAPGSNWPGVSNLDLYTISFQIPDTVSRDNFSTVINLTGNPAAGSTLENKTYTITVNEIPTVTDKSVTIGANDLVKNQFAQGDYLTSVTVVDPDNDQITGVKIISGNDTGAFATDLVLANNTWNIVVNDPTKLNLDAGSYNLVVEATDAIGDASVQDGTVTVNITDKIQSIVIPDTLRIKSDGTVDFTVKYNSTEPNLSGLTSRLHFDDTKLDFVTASIYDNGTINTPPRNSLQTDPNNSQYKIDANGVGVLNDGLNLDGNTTTDKIYLTSWAPGSNWPGVSNLDLYTISFKVADGVTLDNNFSTLINFTGSPAAGYILDAPTNIELTVNQLPVVTGNTFTINENNSTSATPEFPNGASIDVLNITDADDSIANANFKVEIVGGSDAFDVQLIEGAWNLVVKDATKLDFETSPKFDLTIKATDPIGEAAQGTVTVNLNDVNEVPPNTAPVLTPEFLANVNQVSVTSTSTDLDNKLVFYRVDDAATGAIKYGSGENDVLLPGQTGYLAYALLRASENDVVLRGGSEGNSVSGQSFNSLTNPNSAYAPLLIANGGFLNNIFDTLEVNAANTFGGDPGNIVAYYAYSNGNPDKATHFKLEGNSLKVEDLHSTISDNDFNDVVVTFGLA